MASDIYTVMGVLFGVISLIYGFAADRSMKKVRNEFNKAIDSKDAGSDCGEALEQRNETMSSLLKTVQRLMDSVRYDRLFALFLILAVGTEFLK